MNIWLKMKSCSFNRHIMLPSQLTPSPEYPDLQVHEKERSVLVQDASLWQLCCPVLHSSTNQEVKASYKNSLDWNVFTCICTTCIMISWLKFIDKTLVSILRTKPVAFKGLLSYIWCCWATPLLCKWIWPLVISISRAFGLPPSARDNFSCHEREVADSNPGTTNTQRSEKKVLPL